MPIQLHHDAQAELLAAARWYERRRAGLGDDFLSAVLEGLDQIEESPERWPPVLGVRAPTLLRRYVLPDYPYVLPYLVVEEGAFVLAIAHVRRRPGYWVGRVPQRGR